MVTRNRLRVGRKQVLPSRNFVDWKTDDPRELKRQLFDFEKHLSVLVEQNAQLLRIIDGNQTPNRVMPERGFLTFQGGLVRLTQDSRATIATIEHGDLPGGTLHEQADSTQDGFAPSTDGSTTGWVLTVQSDGTIAYAASTGVTDHGALTGLSDDDHTHYLLVSGGRALGGTWSLGGNTLNNAATVNSVSGGTLAFNAIGSGADISATAADSLFLVATAGGIAQSAATTIVLTTPLFDVNAGATGVDIDSTGEINLQTTNGNIVLAAAGSGRDVVVTATDDISLAATDDTFITAGSVLSMGAPDLVVNATNGADVDIGAAGMTIDSTGTLAIATNGANINITAAGGTRDANVTATGEINLNAPIIDVVSNPIHNVEYARFINDAITQSDASGDNDAFSVLNGVPHAVRSSSYNYVINHPVVVKYQDAAEGATVTAQVDLSNIAGKDLSEGAVDFVSFFSFRQAGTGDDAYMERCHYGYYRARNTGTATVTNGSSAWGARVQNWTLGSFVHPNTLTVSGSNDELVTFQLNLPGASGTGRLFWVILATGSGG